MNNTQTPSITDLAIAEIEKEAIALHPVYSIDLLPIHVLGLIARLRAAERDAARYRWMRAGGLYSMPYTDHGAGPEFSTCEEFDADVDAAMIKPEPNPKV